MVSGYIQVQVQPQAAAHARGRKLLGSQHLSPVFQLPMKGERTSDGKAQLNPGSECFLPLTALAEYAESIRIFVAADADVNDTRKFQADCIELQSHDIRKQQGIYKCSSGDGPHGKQSRYLCLHITRQTVQVGSPLHAHSWQPFSSMIAVLVVSFGKCLQMKAATAFCTCTCTPLQAAFE